MIPGDTPTQGAQQNVPQNVPGVLAAVRAHHQESATGPSPSRPAEGCLVQRSSTGTIESAGCQPEGKEASLQYWRQLWAQEETAYEPVKGSPLFRFSAPRFRLAVLYDPQINRVIQVVEHVAR